MSNSYTLPVAIKKAHEECVLSPENMGTCVVHGGPCVNAYHDLQGNVKLDIIGAGLFFVNVSLGQAQELTGFLFS